MLRNRLSEDLKRSMKAKETRTVATLRLILAALKDRDIAARSKGNLEGVSDDDILSMLQSMIKQRRESIDLYKKGGRLELAKQEAEEIEVIEKFLPEQLDENEMSRVIDATIKELKAETLKDMGRTMAALKQNYAGRMDFSKVGAIVKEHLL